MRKLDKHQLKRRFELVGKLADAQSELESSIEEYNHRVEEAFEALVQPKLDALNAIVEDAEQLRDDIYNEAESYADERSDKWRESDAGQSYEEFKESFSESLDPLELDRPEALEAPDMDFSERVEAWPDEVAG